MASALSSDLNEEYEALLQFLYQAPIALVQSTLDGEITLINSMSAQLLMPLSPDGNLANLFDVLAPAAPHLRGLVDAHSGSEGLICESLQLALGEPQADGTASKTLALRLVKLDATTLMASVSDISSTVQEQQLRLAMRLRNVARIDSLTAMPNRTVVLERINNALENLSTDPCYLFAVVFVNVDRFRVINATFGPAAGDDLLRLMAGRLNRTIRLREPTGQPQLPVQTAARLGGDEFVVVLGGVRGVDDVRGVAQRLTEAMCKPYGIGEQQVHVSVSIGVVVSGPSGGDADSVLQNASLAMREAKRMGGARYCIFEPEMELLARRRGSLESELRQALAGGELFVVYQPIVDMVNGGVAGVEALVRWRHPVRGTVSPVEFIGIAEETGLIGPLGKLVLNVACHQFVAWQRLLGARAPQILSVNLSRAQLIEPALVDMVRLALQSSGLAAEQLQLEVTESLAAQDEHIRARLQQLKALGLSIALDDFGTGYSSLASLHQLPVDVVKIDRSFVIQAESSAHHRVLIEATVRVARSLGMQTVAEGIETEGQAAVLAALHCDKGQGYLFARPLPAEEAIAWIAAYQPGLPTRDAAAPVAPAQKLLECLEQTHIAVALFDPQERMAYANRSFLRGYWDGLDGLPTWEDIMRRSHSRRRGLLIETNDIDSWIARVRSTYRQQPRRIFESDMADGSWMRVVEETRADGWQLIVATDVTSLKANEAELRRAHDVALVASITDPLTELPNRRCVFERLAERMAEASALRIPLTVAAIDLDNFKAINDNHGHAVGDQVLVWFARRLAASVRQHDAVGRIGGEEFLLVLANTGWEGAGRVLAGLRAALYEEPLPFKSIGLQVRFSAGVAEGQVGDSAESLCQRADQGLYQAKAEGRNRDCFVAAPSSANALALRLVRPPAGV
ncbi:MAG: diguanylate cyclase [Rhodoferax sp.]|nr:diguanylate cyclase [Rhodoferax sp.]